MSIEIHQEDLEQIITLLGGLAIAAADPQDFLRDIIRRANLPEDWEIDILQRVNLSAASLIYWAQIKGNNPKDARYHTLGSILNVLFKETGDKEKIAIFMIRYNLCDIALLPKDLQTKIDIQDIERQKKEYSVISKSAKDDLRILIQQIENFKIVKNLQEYQYRNDGEKRILEFAWRLRENPRLQGQQLHLKLDDWFSRYSFTPPKITDTSVEHTPQPRLFIQVNPKHSESNQSGASEKFCVQAWLIPDQSWLISDINMLNKNYAENEYFYLDFSYLLSDYGDEIAKFISPNLWTKIKELSRENLAQKEENYPEIKDIRDLSFSKDELRELLELFLNESLLILWYEEQEISRQMDTRELTIEFFLPSELLCDCDIDQWSFRNLAEEDSLDELGCSYQLLIRSLERSKWLQSTDDGNARDLRRNASKRKSWQDKWEIVQSKLIERENPSDMEFQSLHYVTDIDRANLSQQLEQKIGVKLVQGNQRDEILKIIIDEQSIPIVLWTRCHEPLLNFADELNTLVHSEPLPDLPKSVLSLRQTARQSGSKDHLGCHLVLLWDDPNRCTPPEGDVLQLGSKTGRKL
jgi:vWA-MoxR associated protein C-terminal domain